MSFAIQAYANGQWIDANQLAIGVTDTGFVLGVTITEQLRTFGGKLFELERHLDRLERSLSLAGLPLPETRSTLAAHCQRLVEHNTQGLPSGGDLGLAILITPGVYASFAGDQPAGPTLILHTYALPFALWADKYRHGQSLVVPDIRQVPAACWPTEIKCRSRMHYYLADRQAHEREPGARALLIGLDGFVSETSTANVLAYLPGEGLVSPPQGSILSGISLAVTLELARDEGIPSLERPLRADELQSAEEILLTSTPFGVLPVLRFEGAAVGAGEPGRIHQTLLAAWNRRVGLDLAEQARRQVTV